MMRRSPESLAELISQLTNDRNRLCTQNQRMRNALEYLADRESWLGRPEYPQAMLYGHDSPYELAQAALADVGQL
jgi:hypothetical protein